MQLPNQVFLFDIYSAGESKIKKISSANIVKTIKACKKNNATFLDDFSKAEKVIESKIKNNSVVLIMGAGNISNFVNTFLEK